MTTTTDVVPDDHCKCKQHAIIATSEVFPPCKYAEAIELFTHPKKYPIELKKAAVNPEPIKLMEEDGFFIESYPNTPHISQVAHYCPKTHWKTYMDENYMMTHGLCCHCMKEIPPGIIALWKLHNWDTLQKSDAPALTATVNLGI